MIAFSQSFPRWVETEIARLHVRVNRASDKARSLRPRIRNWRRVERVATIAAIALGVLPSELSVPFVCVAAYANLRRYQAEFRRDLYLQAAHRAQGRLRGIVDAASHPARGATLIAPVSFEAFRTGAPN